MVKATIQNSMYPEQVVQIDGLVIMKLIKHCHELEASTSGSGIAQGALLGLVADTRLEITHCFPFPSGKWDFKSVFGHF